MSAALSVSEIVSGSFCQFSEFIYDRLPGEKVTSPHNDESGDCFFMERFQSHLGQHIIIIIIMTCR